MSPFHVKLFGHPDLLDGAGNPVPFRARKHLAVLVYLLIEGRRRPVSRSRLAALLWPDVPERQAFHSLSQALSELRGLLGSHTITRGNRPVRLAEAPASDLDQLREGWAVSESLAEPLLEFDIIAGVEWAHWVDQARAHCQESARRALSARLERHRALGEVRVVSECAAALYQVDPLSESAATALAEQYLLEGRTRDATDLLHRHADRCRRETGADQGAVLRLLQRMQADSRRKIEAEPPSRLALSIPQQVVIGREREFAWLESHWQATCREGPRAVLVHGPPGIGKTSLLEEMTKRTAARAWPAFMVGCEEIGREIPFATTSEIMHAFAKDAAVGGTDPAWLAEAARVTPSLRLRYPGIPEPPPAPPESVQIRVAESLVRMLDAVAEGTPVLLAVDDIHQIDPTSGEVLHLLLRRLDGRPLLLVGSATTAFGPYGSTHAFDRSFHAELPWHGQIDLDPLADEEIIQILSLTVGANQAVSPVVAASIARLSQGRPYLARVLLADWLEEGQSLAAASQEFFSDAAWEPSDMMRQAINRLYGRLPRDAERVLNVLAVAGTKFKLESVASVVGFDPGATEKAAIELLERGIVSAQGTWLTIRNQLHARYVYRMISDDLRRFLHGRIADLLRTPHGADDFESLLQRAVHLARAEEQAAAELVAARAAESAIAHGAPAEAERAIRRVVTAFASREPRLQVLMASALLAQGKNDAAFEAANNAVRSASMDPNVNALALVLLAEAAHRGSQTTEPTLVAAAQLAHEAALDVGDNELILRSLQLAAEIVGDKGELSALTAIEAEVRALATRCKSRLERARADVTLAFTQMNRGEHTSASILLARSEQCFAESGFELERRRCLNGIGICRTASGDFEDARRRLEQALAVAQRTRDSFGEMLGWSNLVTLFTDLGALDNAHSAFKNALDLYERLPSRRQGPDLFCDAATLALVSGRQDDAESFVDAAQTAAQRADSYGARLKSTLAQIDLLIARGQLDDARALAESRLPTSLQALPTTVSPQHLARVRLQLRDREYADPMPGPSIQRNFASRLAQTLEYSVTREKLSSSADDEVPSVAELRARNLHGVIAKLQALRVLP